MKTEQYVPGLATRMMNERDAALERAEAAEARVDRLMALVVEAVRQDFGTPGWRGRVREELFGG